MRMVSCFVVVVSFSTAAAGEPRQPKPDAEQKKFQGVWQFTGLEQDGTKVSKDKLADGKWVFEGDKSTLKFGTSLQESMLALDPSKDPRHVDLAVTAGADKGQTYRGIYKFVDDELVLCFPGNTKAERPKEFSGNAGNGQVIYTLKKKKE